MKISINILLGVLFGTFSATATSADSQNLFQFQELDTSRIEEAHCIGDLCAPMHDINLIEKFLGGEHTKRMVLADGRGLIIPHKMN